MAHRKEARKTSKSKKKSKRKRKHSTSSSSSSDSADSSSSDSSTSSSSDSESDNHSHASKRHRDRSSSRKKSVDSSESSNRKRKSRSSDKKSKKRKRKRSPSSSSSSSSPPPKKKKKKKKSKKKRKTKTKYEGEHVTSESNKIININPLLNPSCSVEETSIIKAKATTETGPRQGPKMRTMTPMTKEQWEKEQNVVRRVFDEDTGRERLIKGDGEVVEECVSKSKQKKINKAATKADGNAYAKRMGIY